jgi:predicted dehydrogenase
MDGLVVATPITAHAETAEEALRLGVPVFVEKPLTTDSISARRLADRGGERLFVMDKWRYHPGVEKLAEIARTGKLGRVLGLRTVRTEWGRRRDDADAVWHLAPHDLAIGMEILGSLPPPAAAACERIADRLVSMTAVLGRSPWMVVEVSARDPGHGRLIRLHCADGIAVLDHPYADHLKVFPGSGIEPGVPPYLPLPISTEMPLLRELRAFVDHLAGGPPPRSSAAEGVAVVEAIEALRARSAV